MKTYKIVSYGGMTADHVWLYFSKLTRAPSFIIWGTPGALGTCKAIFQLEITFCTK